MSRPPRHVIEDAIEMLIALLDIVDGDPDLEDSGDLEPSLAHLTNGGCCVGREPDLEPDEAWAA